MSKTKYTKVSDNMLEDKRFNLADCVIYAKLTYRMKLSVENNKFFDNGYYVIYKINDLSHDCGVSRNVVINSLKKLSKFGLVVKDRKLFGLRLYLPKFKMTKAKSRSKSRESHKAKLTSENQDKIINNHNYISSSIVHVKKSPKSYPKMTQIIKLYGKALVRYAVQTYHKQDGCTLFPIRNPYHFIVGILRRWAHKGIRTVNDAKMSEHDQTARFSDDNGPEIPIFKI